MRLACTLEYKGTNYHGFQDQADLHTVQGEINKALKKISIEPESFNYSGRTDAGVHALGQVFDFETSVKRTPEDWLNGLNSNLPKTIAITSIQEVEPDFHSRMIPLEIHWDGVPIVAPARKTCEAQAMVITTIFVPVVVLGILFLVSGSVIKE